MKIVDITHFYNQKSGGVKRYIQLKAKFLSSFSDISHYIIVPGQEDEIKQLYNSTVFYVKSPEVLFWKPYRLIVSKKRVAEVISSIEPDIVEVGSPFILPKLINELKHSLGFKTVGFFHSNLEESFSSVFSIKSKKMSTLIRRYTQSSYADFDIVISPSELVKRYLNSIGIKNVAVVRIGIDTSIFFPMDKQECKELYGIPNDKINILYVGRFSKDKGIYDLIDIFKTIKAVWEDRFIFHLVGSGPEEDKIKQMANQKEFIISSYIENQNDLAKVYNAADIFLSASKSDTYGISILEAQSCGIPVIAYKNTSFEELVYYKNLLAEDKYHIIKLLSKLRLEDYDRYRLHTYIKSNFSLEHCYNELLSIYNLLMEKDAASKYT